MGLSGQPAWLQAATQETHPHNPVLSTRTVSAHNLISIRGSNQLDIRIKAVTIAPFRKVCYLSYESFSKMDCPFSKNVHTRLPSNSCCLSEPGGITIRTCLARKSLRTSR